MTVVVDVTYPFGYVHATPWGTHVNEGAVEWPPSPWRVLRALIATWHTRFPDLDGEIVQRLLGLLAAPPAIRVAPRCEASVRSYLPDESYRSGAASPSTDLVVDAFAAVAPGAGISYRWDVDLDDHARRALGELVGGLPYLGRAESVCEASVRFEDDEGDGWLLPAGDVNGSGRRTLVPRSPLDLDAVCVSISAMRAEGRLQPLGAEWVRYDVEPPVRPMPRIERHGGSTEVRAVRFALRARAPVSVRRSLVVAERMRKATMSQYGQLAAGGSTAAFVGRDATGEKLLGNRHAHWLPLDVDGDKLLDTLVVWVPDGVGAREVAALGAVRRLQFHGGDGMGSVDRIAVALERVGTNLGEVGIPKLTGRGRSWRSATPFLPQRHAKRQTVEEHLIDCAGRELRARGIRTPFELSMERETSWGSFRRKRSGERLSQARSGFGVNLLFEAPVDGPICIGLLSHFGMGRFEVDQ